MAHKRNTVILIAEYDDITNPDELAQIWASTSTMWEGVISTTALVVSPEIAAAHKALLAPRPGARPAEFAAVRRDAEPRPI